MNFVKVLSIIVFLAFCFEADASHPVLNRPTLKVLDIGNSFTNDATDLLPLIAEVSGSDVSKVCLYKAIRSSGSLKTGMMSIVTKTQDIHIGLKKCLAD
jgi:hypothetical protein